MQNSFQTQVKRILDKTKRLDLKLNKTLEMSDVKKIETEKQITLPESYVVFLTQIENGGMGPYGGIYSLQESIKQSELTETSLSEFNEYVQDDDLNQQKTESLNGEELEEKIAERLGQFFAGSMDICEYGSGDFFRLIVTGKSAGKVWNYSYDDTGLYNLNVDILTFFENWLDREIEKKQYPEKKYPAHYSVLEFGRNPHYELIEN